MAVLVLGDCNLCTQESWRFLVWSSRARHFTAILGDRLLKKTPVSTCPVSHIARLLDTIGWHMNYRRKCRETSWPYWGKEVLQQAILLPKHGRSNLHATISALKWELIDSTRVQEHVEDPIQVDREEDLQFDREDKSKKHATKTVASWLLYDVRGQKTAAATEIIRSLGSATQDVWIMVRIQGRGLNRLSQVLLLEHYAHPRDKAMCKIVPVLAKVFSDALMKSEVRWKALFSLETLPALPVDFESVGYWIKFFRCWDQECFRKLLFVLVGSQLFLVENIYF